MSNKKPVFTVSDDLRFITLNSANGESFTRETTEEERKLLSRLDEPVGNTSFSIRTTTPSISPPKQAAWSDKSFIGEAVKLGGLVRSETPGVDNIRINIGKGGIDVKITFPPKPLTDEQKLDRMEAEIEHLEQWTKDHEESTKILNS